MIPKPIEQVEEPELESLRENRVAEGKTIEYKRELPGTTNDEKKEFLKDVTSFANTEGGDLLYGVEAVEGVPVGFPGIGKVIQDDLKLRLENLCRDGVEPRLPTLGFRFIPVASQVILLIRVAKSWNAPHRVKLAGHGHFYGRNSAGAFQLDVGELRTAFTLSQGIAERMRDFRVERLGKIHMNDTPVPIEVGCKMMLHLAPLSAFAGGEQIDMSLHRDLLRQFHPFSKYSSAYRDRINLDGLVTYGDLIEGRSLTYTQVFRSGIVEAVGVFSKGGDGVKRIHSRTYEDLLIRALPTYLRNLQALQVEPPIFLFLSFVGATGYIFSVPEGPGQAYGFENSESDRDVLVVPEVSISAYGGEADKILRPAFDVVWNAFGYAGSKNYDPAGNWR